ncbi:MAG: ABC transporter transmembrane domain-containing protein, partial [Atopobium minutum]|nr:ABC transporter transmembrane domain-containing protein [Atopobium minutum]
MNRQSKAKVLFRMLGLVKPLAGWMVLTVLMGTLGFLAAQFIPILGAYGILCGLENRAFSPLWLLWASLIACALLRAVFRLIEQRTNHYIAFTLLAIVRDKVFKALRKLCPAKLEGRDKGDLISLITSDVELLEVFYAHTISPICIAVLTSGIMCVYIGHFHWSLGLLALVAFLVVGVVLPLVISKQSGTVGDALRAQSGELAAFMLENIRGLDETIQYGCANQRLTAINQKTDELSKRQALLNRLTGTNLALANTLI